MTDILFSVSLIANYEKLIVCIVLFNGELQVDFSKFVNLTTHLKVFLINLKISKSNSKLYFILIDLLNKLYQQKNCL